MCGDAYTTVNIPKPTKLWALRVNWWYLNNNFLKYLFIYFLLHWVLVSAGQIFTVVWGLSSCGTWVLECMCSVVAALRLICSMACGIEHAFSALESGFLSTGPPRKFSFKWKVSKEFKRQRTPAVWHEPLAVSYFLIPEYKNYAYCVSGTVLGALHTYVII